MSTLRRLFGLVIRRILPRSIIKRIYRYLALQYIRKLDIDVDPSRKTILVLNHYYDQDINALSSSNPGYNFVTIHSPTLFKGAKLFFREDIVGLLAPYTSENATNISEYRQECQIIFKALKDKFGANLLVTASDNYYWVRELITVVREYGVKTIVLDKEGLISPYDFDALVERIKLNAPFMSDYLFVWSDRQRRFWEKMGVSPELITVIGQPRSDLFYSPMDYLADCYFDKKRPIITFFTYADDAYIPIDKLVSNDFSWKKMKEQTHDFLLETAISHPEYNFIFKAHPQQLDLKELQQKYECSNLRVIGGANISNELIIRSELIIAFQTTAILEAMFLNKNVIYTGWSPLEELLKGQILPFYDAPGIQVARTFEQFKICCGRFFAGDKTDFEFTPEEDACKNNLVSEYLYKPDGHVCERFYVKISEFL